MRTFHTEIVYQQGVSLANEDRYLIKEEQRLFAVMDGAMGIGDLTGELAAQTISDTLSTLKGQESLLEKVQEANQRLGQKMLELTSMQNITEIPKPDRSSTGIAAVRFLENHQIEYVHSGDCMIFVEYEDGSVRALTYDAFSILDQTAINKRVQLLEEKRAGEDPNTWSEEKQKEVNQEILRETKDILRSLRSTLNTPKGYPMIDGSPEAIDYLEYGRLPLIRIQKVLLLTDGLVLPHIKGAPEVIWLETAKFAFRKGLAALNEKVIELEEEDPTGYLYPRFKKSDDKTGILVKLG